MSSACAKLDSGVADVLLENVSSSTKKCSNGSKHHCHNGPEDAHESDGDNTGNTGNNGHEHEGLEGKETKLSSHFTLQPGDLSPKPSDEEDDDDFEVALQQIFSESAPVKLLSAMKGSREKLGLSPRKLNVKWAPEVYDPPPSIVSHTRGKKQQKSKSKDKENHKKTGKKGQKGGNSSRGAKDKKQSRKNSRAMDSYCGSSFLKPNLTKVHCSVAEAL